MPNIYEPQELSRLVMLFLEDSGISSTLERPFAPKSIADHIRFDICAGIYIYQMWYASKFKEAAENVCVYIDAFKAGPYWLDPADPGFLDRILEIYHIYKNLELSKE